MSRIKVLIVDDAVVMRRIISEAITQDPELELAGWASNGKLALARISELNPDCITLDVEMPEMDGIQTVAEIRKIYPRLPVIMFSTVTEKGAQKTMEALAGGATDYVTKPANVGSVAACVQRLREELIPKIKAYSRRSLISQSSIKAPYVPPVGRGPSLAKQGRISVVCIASSTGGPNALAEVIPALAANFPVPVVIVQHMPPVFTTLFAVRLNEKSPLNVEEAVEGREIRPGSIYIAPGGLHLEVAQKNGKVVCLLTQDPPENSCRPAADVLFRSVVKTYGGNVLGVVLTGMGRDGLRGCEQIVKAGGRVLAQDEATSVVWGMPGSVTEAGLPEEVLAIERMANAINERALYSAGLRHAS